MNNKIFAGLILQIPNALIVIGIMVAFLTSLIDIQWLTENLQLIVVGVMFLLINIASLIFLFIGIIEK